MDNNGHKIILKIGVLLKLKITFFSFFLFYLQNSLDFIKFSHLTPNLHCFITKSR